MRTSRDTPRPNAIEFNASEREPAPMSVPSPASRDRTTPPISPQHQDWATLGGLIARSALTVGLPWMRWDFPKDHSLECPTDRTLFCSRGHRVGFAPNPCPVQRRVSCEHGLATRR
jgi:hypothetical protein